jgi:hypothetical protein
VCLLVPYLVFLALNLWSEVDHKAPPENAWRRAHLDPPGAELAWFENQPSKLAILVAVWHYNHLINQHLVAIFNVVNANLRVFSDCRSFDHFSI